MKNTLYSLMLNDEVVRQVDILAHRMGTSRSNLVNQILADYVNYTTPERRINDILSAMEELLSPSGELVPFFAPNSMSMSVKSSLRYKYRPTVKYEVELYRSGEESIGQLTVAFRTQSAGLIEAMTGFFRLWKRLEDTHRASVNAAPVRYALFEGRLVRSIAMPARECSSRELAEVISGYVQLFDTLLKEYLGGGMDERGVERAYLSYLAAAPLHI